MNTNKIIETHAKEKENIQESGPSTRAVHANKRDNPYHALADPVVQTAAFTFRDTADLMAFMEANEAGTTNGRVEYGRYGNPTVRAVEERLAGLENAEDTLLFSSGMAAVTSVLLALLSSGDHVIITNDCYKKTRQFCADFLNRLGITSTVIPMNDIPALDAAVRPKTRLLVSETPTNPFLRVADLETFVSAARRHNLLTLIDATLSTPLNLRPLDYGVDLVVHSATKYLSGHNDLLAGCVSGNKENIKVLRDAIGVMGAVADPHNASLLLRGIKTLALRVARHNQNGLAVSQYLESSHKIERVWYPGLASHPDHDAASRQMSGFGGVVSFTVKGGLEHAARFVDAVQIPVIAPSFGGPESLIEQPALQAYFPLTSAEREAIGISDNLVRLALGIEDTADLIADLEQALKRF